VATPLYLDAVDHAVPLVTWLAAHGYEVQRPFTRMVYRDTRAPGDADKVMLVAGPELG